MHALARVLAWGWLRGNITQLLTKKWSRSVLSNSLCPMEYSLPGSSIHGIFQARVLEWGAISSSRGSSGARDRTWVSCIAGRCFTVWATWETLNSQKKQHEIQGCGGYHRVISSALAGGAYWSHSHPSRSLWQRVRLDQPRRGCNQPSSVRRGLPILYVLPALMRWRGRGAIIVEKRGVLCQELITETSHSRHEKLRLQTSRPTPWIGAGGREPDVRWGWDFYFLMNRTES